MLVNTMRRYDLRFGLVWFGLAQTDETKKKADNGQAHGVAVKHTKTR